MDQADRLVFIDIETAGFKPTAPLIELAAIAVTSGSFQELETLEMKIAFEMKDACPRSLGVTKFSPSLWERYALPPEDAAAKLAVFLRRHAIEEVLRKKPRVSHSLARLAAYNAAYDGPRVDNWATRLGVYLPIRKRSLCVMQRTLWFFEENQGLTPPRDYKLATIAEHLGLTAMPTHSALDVVRATVELARVLAEHNRITTTRAA
ncbi:exonuclease domain-containing protein [Botrimarina mediterranea]|uniref:Exonuclease domain-containing protein n=1 Tax=Botrimarina mediterranea TaxID=2528022 RepID=A0A518K9Q3_9BACT|nr:exonuclease domain-containing protein [Botrimarina mediterranea]QDV74527.1 hypothetical protein Spa11_27310 [Botrimarina mediterranea]QDV79167.1 hypothetical protein K2D_27780 [Planctomycetes bacterium K2D]